MEKIQLYGKSNMDIIKFNPKLSTFLRPHSFMASTFSYYLLFSLMMVLALGALAYKANCSGV
jgi:hypothetical protein